MDPRLRTAYHEAGHFVVAMLRPCRALSLTSVSICEDGDYSGRVHHLPITHLRDSEIWSLCGILVAGYEAESKAVGAPAPEHATTDLRQVQQWLAELAVPGAIGSDPHSTISLSRRIHREIRELLTKHWPRVERLARALALRETLTADEARRLVIPPPKHEAAKHEPPNTGHTSSV